MSYCGIGESYWRFAAEALNHQILSASRYPPCVRRPAVAFSHAKNKSSGITRPGATEARAFKRCKQAGLRTVENKVLWEKDSFPRAVANSAAANSGWSCSWDQGDL